MEIRSLFLTAVLVNARIPSVQPKFQMDTKANANNEVQQNLRSLFDSLSKNDMKKTDSLRNILEREAEKEQKAFDTIKEDLRLAREENAYRQRSLYKIGDKGGEAAVFKRETDGNTATCKAPVEGNRDAATGEPSTEADEFHGYVPNIIYDWDHVVKAYERKDIKFLRYFCTKVHHLAGWGKVKVINNFILDTASILYKNPMYFPTETKFLQYVIDQPQTFENETQDHFYLTNGLKEDCVFYLIPTDPQKLTAFNLGHHVCDIHRALKGTVNVTSTLPPGIEEPVEG